MVTKTLYAKQKKRHRGTEHFWTLWEKARVGMGFRMGETCTAMADSCQCMANITTML